MSDRAVVAQWLSVQAGWCRSLGSPLYASLLERAAGDVEQGGLCWDVLRERAADEGEKGGSALALRFMASVHRLVLRGDAPELAAHSPSVGGSVGDEDDTWRSFVDVVRDHADELRVLVARPCPTNEVGRSAAVVGGFLTVASETGLPLRVLEIGGSAGLNLRWDHYRYEAGPSVWGDPSSPVRFDDVYEGTTPPPFEGEALVAEREGCDLDPIDPSTEDGRLALRSFVWADQVRRLRLLEGALEIAARVSATVDRADAVEWTRDRLAVPRDGVATVLFHSVVMDQVPLAARTAIRTSIEEAAARATDDAPLAWLRMEGSYSYARLRFQPHEVWLTTWPGGNERKVADTGAHGMPVRWIP